MKNIMPVYSVVIPVYKSENTINELCERLINVFSSQVKQPFEIIMVDDASPDNSWDKMKELYSKDQRIKIIRLARNFGQHNALMCGLNYVSGDYIITMDDDLQHPPEEIPKLIAAIADNPDMDAIIGEYEIKKHSWWRNLGSYINWLIIMQIFNLSKNRRSSSFRLIRGSTAKEIIKYTTYQPRIGQLLKLVTERYDFVRVNHNSRKHGKSGYTIWKLVRDFINNILNNSRVILRLTSILGFSSAGLSLILALYYFVKFFTVGIAVPGFTTIILINLFFSGIVLFSLGVVGEYLMKILLETRKHPQFIIQHKHF